MEEDQSQSEDSVELEEPIDINQELNPGIQRTTLEEAWTDLKFLVQKLDDEIQICEQYDEVMGEISDPPMQLPKDLKDKLAPFFTYKEATTFDENTNEIWYRIISDNINPKYGEKMDVGANKFFIITDIKQAFDNIDPQILIHFFESMTEEPLVSFKQFFIKWLNWAGSEELSFGEHYTITRSKGLPQGSQWTPAMWSLYLSLVLKELGLQRNTICYADNIFFAFPESEIQKVKPFLENLKIGLKKFKLEVNDEETTAIWFCNKKSWKMILETQGLKIPTRQRVLGYHFRYDSNKGLWKYSWSPSIKYYRPWQIDYSPFAVKLQEYFSRQIGRETYQLIGFLQFATEELKITDDYMQNIYFNAHNWLSMERISYVDLITLNLDPRWLVVKMVLRNLLYSWKDTIFAMKVNKIIRNEVETLYKSKAIFPHSDNIPDDFEKGNVWKLNIPLWINESNRERCVQNALALLLEIDNTIQKSTVHIQIQDPAKESGYNNLSLQVKFVKMCWYIHQIAAPTNRFQNGQLSDAEIHNFMKYESFWYTQLNKEVGSKDRIAEFLDQIEEHEWTLEKLKDTWTNLSIPEVSIRIKKWKLRKKEDYKTLDSFLAICRLKSLNQKNGYWNEDAKNRFLVLIRNRDLRLQNK
jgi:hypothetical protein